MKTLEVKPENYRFILVDVNSFLPETFEPFYVKPRRRILRYMYIPSQKKPML
jgi:hypothetical protein